MGAMTDLLGRADRGVEGAAVRGSRQAELPASVAAAASAVAAVLSGLAGCLLLAMVGWVAGPRGEVVEGVRAGALGWLMGHGSGLQVGTTEISATPLGLTLLLGAVVWRGGRWAAEQSEVADARAVVLSAATLAACYAALATLVSLLASSDAASVSPLRAMVGSFLVAVVFGGAGLAVGAGGLRGLTAGWPDDVVAALRGGLGTVAVLLGLGAAAVTVGLVADFGRAATVADSLAAGTVGGAVLTVLGVLLLPNAALLASAYLMGPGFVLGTGTLVAPTGVDLGPVPAVPLLAALPSDGAAPVWALLLVGAPVLAGAIGAAVALRAHPVDALDAAALRGGVAGVLGGTVAGLLTGLAGGSVGPGRMADVGALVWQCAGVAGVAAGIGGAVAGLVLAWRARRRA